MTRAERIIHTLLESDMSDFVNSALSSDLDTWAQPNGDDGGSKYFTWSTPATVADWPGEVGLGIMVTSSTWVVRTYVTAEGQNAHGESSVFDLLDDTPEARSFLSKALYQAAHVIADRATKPLEHAMPQNAGKSWCILMTNAVEGSVMNRPEAHQLGITLRYQGRK